MSSNLSSILIPSFGGGSQQDYIFICSLGWFTTQDSPDSGSRVLRVPHHAQLLLSCRWITSWKIIMNSVYSSSIKVRLEYLRTCFQREKQTKIKGGGNEMVHQVKELVKPKSPLSNSRDGEEPRVVLRLSYTYCGTRPTFPMHTQSRWKKKSAINLIFLWYPRFVQLLDLWWWCVLAWSPLKFSCLNSHCPNICMSNAIHYDRWGQDFSYCFSECLFSTQPFSLEPLWHRSR